MGHRDIFSIDGSYVVGMHARVLFEAGPKITRAPNARHRATVWPLKGKNFFSYPSLSLVVSTTAKCRMLSKTGVLFLASIAFLLRQFLYSIDKLLNMTKIPIQKLY